MISERGMFINMHKHKKRFISLIVVTFFVMSFFITVGAVTVSAISINDFDTSQLKTNSADFTLSTDTAEKNGTLLQLNVHNKIQDDTSFQLEITYDGMKKNVVLQNQTKQLSIEKNDAGYYELPNEDATWLFEVGEAKNIVVAVNANENKEHLGELHAFLSTNQFTDEEMTEESEDTHSSTTSEEMINESSVAKETENTTTSMTETTQTSSLSQIKESKSAENGQSRSKKAVRDGLTGNPEVPKGAILLDGIFGDINEAGSGSKGNSGVNTIHDPDVNNGMPYSEITLSGKKNWLSIWSNDQYKMDFSDSFHGRTYINFGEGTDADGLAFVMQNDNANALTGANTSDDGQNLGVYGNNKTNILGMNKPNEKAVQNSVAIEFDLYTNNSGAHLFDETNAITPHMAYTFPSNLKKGYKSNSILGENHWGIGDTAIVRHQDSKILNGVVGDNIRDGTWYEFRYDFDVTTQTFSYYLKNPLTDNKTEVVTIPWDDLSSELALSDNNMKAYWGFTGSNGSAQGTVKFVFTQVPVNLSTQIENDVLVDEESIVDVDEHDQFSPELPSASDKDELTFRTHFSVEEGEAGLDITAWKSTISGNDIDLTQDLTNVCAQMDGKTYSGEAVVNEQTGEIEVTFSDLVVQPGHDVYLSYTAKPLQHIEASKSYFSSQVLTTEIGNDTSSDFLSNQVAFWFRGNQPPVLSQVKTEKDTFSDFVDSFGYSFSYQDVDDDDLTFDVAINGILVAEKQPLKGTSLNQIFQANENEKIDLLNDTTAFKTGENILTITLSDGIHAAVTKEVSFTVVGYFGFEELTDHYEWQYAKSDLGKTDVGMPRQKEMKIKIRDTRQLNQSENVKVKFSATSTDGALETERFVFDDQPLDDLSLPINKELVYAKDQGLLLKLNDQTNAKKVTGNVVWTIVDAP